jgi:hypothetical protein
MGVCGACGLGCDSAGWEWECGSARVCTTFSLLFSPCENTVSPSSCRFTPSIYRLYIPEAPLGQSINNEGMLTTDIARMYHSIATLTPMTGCVLVTLAGSNPYNQVVSRQFSRRTSCPVLVPQSHPLPTA